LFFSFSEVLQANSEVAPKTGEYFLISNFRRVLNIVFFLWGDSETSEHKIQTPENNLNERMQQGEDFFPTFPVQFICFVVLDHFTRLNIRLATLLLRDRLYPVFGLLNIPIFQVPF